MQSVVKSAAGTDVNEIVARLVEIQPGQKVVYHKGFLSRDLTASSHDDDARRAVANDADIAARAAWDAWDAWVSNRAHLVQRACKEGWEYIAVGAHRSRDRW